MLETFINLINQIVSLLAAFFIISINSCLKLLKEIFLWWLQKNYESHEISIVQLHLKGRNLKN